MALKYLSNFINKLIIFIGLLSVILCSCNKTTDFKVNGIVKNMDGTIVELTKDDLIYDKAIIKNGSFSLSAKLPILEQCVVKFSGVYPKGKKWDTWSSIVNVFVEKGASYTITGNGSDDFSQQRCKIITTSKGQKSFNDYKQMELNQRVLTKKSIENLEIKRAHFLDLGDMIQYVNYTDSIGVLETNSVEVYDKLRQKYINNHPNTYCSIYLLSKAHDIERNFDFYKSIYNQLTPEFKEHIYAETYKKKADQILKMNNRGFKVNILAKSSTEKAFNIADFSGSKLIVVDVWASWCIPCKNEMPAAKKMQAQLSKQKVAYIFLSIDEKRSLWKNANAKLKLEGSYLLDSSFNKKFQEDLLISSIPRYLIINNKGELLSKDAPRPSQSAFLPLVNKLLN
ncbi:TlpA disulfide reductase family protein [Pedobacter nyackensis]|uniref:Thiol-disulfide isomerase or thioredoxin n=1 Tax=Pedobacter nyackensis TaxID=475255 RepID=A0A1W2AL77_9SPHI|nr:TlpA disulfide reductase family protein [Pedobacter nyackensis]SMC61489.1 Thiol-disulfide isomerase or thioredoxin [Pedobacter nyackensis]